MRSRKQRDRQSRTSRDEPANAEDVRERSSNDDVARRAYKRYEANGRADGNDLDDWLDAERELRGTKRG
jgi:hypothetical protein